MTAHLEFVKGNGFFVEFIRTSRRKTASVKVDDGKVSVVVPEKLADSRIEELVNKKSRWIKEKLLIHRESRPIKPKEYISGECFTYIGRNYRLKVITGSTSSVKLVGGRLTATLPDGSKKPEKVCNALVAWYRYHAEKRLMQKVERYAKIVGVEPVSVGIKSFKSRWGSCSVKGGICFNWKIIIAPNRIVDYVVVHELCHMKQHNHAPAFWKCVERVIPDYLECKEWLKVNCRLLEI
jgi:predicted metal-dependent hydrolase